MKRCLTLILLAMVVIGCSQNKPTPTAFTAPTTPVAAATATQEPSATALPASPTEVATLVSAVTSTPASTSTSAPSNTPAATATNTRAPITPRLRATATNTAVALKYGAPQLIEPGAPGSHDTFVANKDDLRFKWQPVADLGTSECYQVTVRMTNLADPAQNYAQDSFLAQNTCNSTMAGGALTFSLLKRNPPTYSGLIALAEKLGGPSDKFDVKWWVTVVRSDSTLLSPASAQFEFSVID